MGRPQRHVIDSPAGSHQGLADDLPAIYPLPARLRRAAAEEIQLKRLEIEDLDQLLDGGGHYFSNQADYVSGRVPLHTGLVPGSSPARSIVLDLHHDA